MVSPEGDPEYMQKSGTPPPTFSTGIFWKKNVFLTICELSVKAK